MSNEKRHLLGEGGAGTADSIYAEHTTQPPTRQAIRRIFAETWDPENKIWFLAPYSFDELRLVVSP